MPNSLIKNPPADLKPREWVTAAHVEMQGKVVTFLLIAYGFVIVATFGLMTLEGFHYKGFALGPTLLTWLGRATIGELAGLLGLVIRSIFRR